MKLPEVLNINDQEYVRLDIVEQDSRVQVTRIHHIFLTGDYTELEDYFNEWGEQNDV